MPCRAAARPGASARRGGDAVRRRRRRRRGPAAPGGGRRPRATRAAARPRACRGSRSPRPARSAGCRATAAPARAPRSRSRRAGRGGVGVVRVGEPRQRRRVDREHVEPPARVAALLEDRLRDVLVGPLAEELATAPDVRGEGQREPSRPPPARDTIGRRVRSGLSMGMLSDPAIPVDAGSPSPSLDPRPHGEYRMRRSRRLNRKCEAVAPDPVPGPRV